MNLTVSVLIVTALFLVLFDVWIISKKGKPESLSAHIIRMSRQMPLLTLLFGILLGHLFWSMRTEDIYHNTKCITGGEK